MAAAAMVEDGGSGEAAAGVYGPGRHGGCPRRLRCHRTRRSGERWVTGTVVRLMHAAAVAQEIAKEWREMKGGSREWTSPLMPDAAEERTS